jgi:hypothetical protein
MSDENDENKGSNKYRELLSEEGKKGFDNWKKAMGNHLIRPIRNGYGYRIEAEKKLKRSE